MARRLGLVPRAMLGYLFLSEARSRRHFDTLPPSAEVRAQAGAGPVLAEGERRMQEAFAGLLAHVHSRQWGAGCGAAPGSATGWMLVPYYKTGQNGGGERSGGEKRNWPVGPALLLPPALWEAPSQGRGVPGMRHGLPLAWWGAAGGTRKRGSESCPHIHVHSGPVLT